MYIKPNEAFKRLNAASITRQPVYIYGSTGYGKTELIKQFFNKKKYIYIKTNVFGCDFSEVMASANKDITVVVDDLHNMENENDRQMIRSMCECSNIWLILVSRGPVPRWLLSISLEFSFFIISEEQLKFNSMMIKEMLELEAKDCDIGELENISIASQGMPMAMLMAKQELQAGKELGDALIEKIANTLFLYLEKSVIEEWNSDIAEFMMKMSLVGDFTERQAVLMTGNNNAMELIERAMEIGSFLTKEGHTYHIRVGFITPLKRQAYKTFSEGEIKDYYLLAGKYYEMEDDILKALEIYSKNDNKTNIINLLVRNSKKAPDVAYYYQMKKYYFMLSDEDISRNVFLMKGMCQLTDILLDFEKSEYWYNKLLEFKETAVGSQKKEVVRQIAYLDIALIHRGTIDIITLIKSYTTLLKDRSIPIPQFSVTSNMPSVMNGGKDFCEWSKNDRTLAMSIGKMVSAFLGRYGKGLVNLSLAESFFEKRGDNKEISSLLSRARTEMSFDGKTQMIFALVGVQVRFYLSMGEVEHARRILDSFEKDTPENELNMHLKYNIAAIRCRLDMYEGNFDGVDEYMKNSPDENVVFYTMFRYCYLTKIRCYIAKERYLEAISLIDTMDYYAEKAERTYISMELMLLRTIVRKRCGEQWQEEFIELLKKLSDYKFIRLVSEQCSAAYELLNEISERAKKTEGIDNEWFMNLIDETGKQARRYKIYMKNEQKEIPDISPFDIRVLSCLADGLSVSETSKQLKVNYETLRSRIKEIYKRLGAKNKTEAVMLAQSLRLI